MCVRETLSCLLSQVYILGLPFKKGKKNNPFYGTITTFISPKITLPLISLYLKFYPFRSWNFILYFLIPSLTSHLTYPVSVYLSHSCFLALTSYLSTICPLLNLFLINILSHTHNSYLVRIKKRGWHFWAGAIDWLMVLLPLLLMDGY